MESIVQSDGGSSQAQTPSHQRQVSNVPESEILCTEASEMRDVVGSLPNARLASGMISQSVISVPSDLKQVDDDLPNEEEEDTFQEQREMAMDSQFFEQ